MSGFQILQISVPVRGSAASVYQIVSSAYEAPTGRHQELCKIPDFVRSSGPSCRQKHGVLWPSRCCLLLQAQLPLFSYSRCLFYIVVLSFALNRRFLSDTSRTEGPGSLWFRYRADSKKLSAASHPLTG